MIAYELRFHLENLQLAGYEDGDYVWLGTEKEWNNTYSQISQYEQNPCTSCIGSGSKEEMGDGDNFENDVIDHRDCPECSNREFTCPSINE